MCKKLLMVILVMGASSMLFAAHEGKKSAAAGVVAALFGQCSSDCFKQTWRFPRCQRAAGLSSGVIAVVAAAYSFKSAYKCMRDKTAE